MPHSTPIRLAARLLFLAALTHSACADQPASPVTKDPGVANGIDREVVLYSTRGDNRLHIVDAKDLAPIASYDIGLGAHELVVSPDGRWVIASAYGGPGPGHQPADDRVAIFDLHRSAMHRTIDLDPMSRPNDAAFLPDSVHAYLTVEVPPRVLHLNVETGEHRAIVLQHKGNHMLALSPDARRLYISHVMPGSLTTIDTSIDSVVSRVDLPAGAEGLAVTQDNTRVWVGCNRSDVIAIVDPVSGKVERSVPCPGFPLRLRASPDGAVMAVSCPKSGDVALFAAADPDRVRRVAMRDQATGDAAPALSPSSIAFTANGVHLAVVAAGPQADIVLIDVESGSIAARRSADGPIADALATARLRLPAPTSPPAKK